MLNKICLDPGEGMRVEMQKKEKHLTDDWLGLFGSLQFFAGPLRGSRFVCSLSATPGREPCGRPGSALQPAAVPAIRPAAIN